MTIWSEIGFNSLRGNEARSLSVSNPRIAKSLIVVFFFIRLYKLFYNIGVGISLDRYQSRLTFYNSIRDRKLYKCKQKTEIYLNIGSGAFRHPYWTNIDYEGQSKYYQKLQGEPGIDFINMNLCENNKHLPFDDNTVRLIYCSHTLEHLQKEHAIFFLRECRRVLQSGGVLRLALPNINSDFEVAKILYEQLGSENGLFQEVCRKICNHMLSPSAGIEINNLLDILEENNFNPESCFNIFESICDVKFDEKNPERHISYWSHERLAETTKELGYTFYIPLYRGSSTSAPFKNIDLFDNTEPHISIYGELIK
jgi:predicted SAM-dependent methyltransferase